MQQYIYQNLRFFRKIFSRNHGWELQYR